MTAPELTSVIMVTFHTGEGLMEAVSSVLAQTADVELILVNNGNPPEIEAALVDRFKDEPLVRLLTGHGNIGLARARNLGARMAQGNRLLFLGDDCVIAPETLVHLYYQEKHLTYPFIIGARVSDAAGDDEPNARRGYLTPKTALIEALGMHKWLKRQPLKRGRETLPDSITRVAGVSRSFMYMAKEVFWRFRGFDEQCFLYGEDWDFFLRFGAGNGAVYFDPVVPVWRRTSQKLTNFSREKLKSAGLIYYFKKNFKGHTPYIILRFLFLCLCLRAIARTIGGCKV